MRTGLTQENLEKSFKEFDLLKAKKVYKDNSENRKKGRAGQTYGKENETDIANDKKISELKDKINKIKSSKDGDKSLVEGLNAQIKYLEKKDLSRPRSPKSNLTKRKDSERSKERRIEAYSSSTDFLGDRNYYNDLKIQKKDLTNQLNEHELELDEVYMDARKAGFTDDPAEFQGYKDHQEGSADINKELAQVESDLAKINKKIAKKLYEADWERYSW